MIYQVLSVVLMIIMQFQFVSNVRQMLEMSDNNWKKFWIGGLLKELPRVVNKEKKRTVLFWNLCILGFSILLGGMIYALLAGGNVLFTVKSIFLFSESVSISYFLLAWLLACIWQWKVLKRKSWYLFFYLVFPICQFFSFVFVLWDIQKMRDLHILYMLGMVSGAVSSMILFYVIFEQSRRTEIEKKLRETRYAAELERAHFANIEKEREEMEQTRRELQEKLKEAGELMRKGEKGRAVLMLDDLEDKIEASREYPYCSIPVINAVLTEKEKDCKKKQINLEVDINIGRNIAIDSIYLCSIFANLMDNAINACEMLEVKERSIYLKAVVKGSYLIVQEENPYIRKKTVKTEKGHGYGTKILKEIAERFHGEYHVTEKNGRYKATVTLLTENDKENS